MTLTEAQVYERLQDAIRTAGGQKQFAEQHGFSQAYVSDLIKRRRPFADRMLEALGLERVTLYQEAGTLSGTLPVSESGDSR